MTGNRTRFFVFIFISAFIFSTFSARAGSIYTPKYGVPNGYAVSASPWLYVTLEFSVYGCEWQVSQDSTFKTRPLRDTLVASMGYKGITIKYLDFNRKYFWRARAIYAKDTSQWSTVFSFTTFDRPQLSQPYNNRYGGDTLTLVNPGTNEYVCEVDTVSSFTSGARQSHFVTGNDVTTWASQVKADVTFGHWYYWRARAMMKGDTTPWSDTWRFYTGGDTLLGIKNGSTGTQDSVNLTWTNNIKAHSAELQYDTTEAFNSPLLTDTFVLQPLPAKGFPASNLHFGKKYYWRIRNTRPGDTSAWTKTWTFGVFSGPKAGYPYQKSTLYWLGDQFRWGTTGYYRRYIIEIDSSAGFSSPILERKLVHGESATLDLRYNTTYYYRIREYNDADTSPWTQTVMFYTGPRAKTALGPGSGSTDQPLNMTVYTPCDGTLYGVMEIDTSSLFQSPLYRRDTLKHASYGVLFYDTLQHLRFNTKYYYRARTYYLNDSNGLSDVYWFTTVARPANYFPGNGQPNIGVGTNLLVNKLQGATGYLWQLDTSKTFASKALRQGYTGTTTAGTGDNFYFKKKYWYRFAAVNEVDTSDWSDAWSFGSTDTMYLTSPKLATTNVPARTTLVWGGVIGASGYQYQVSMDKTFSGVAPVYVNGDDNFADVGPLQGGKRYYWRMRAIDSTDTSRWSLTWYFNTHLVPAPILQVPYDKQLNVQIPNRQCQFMWDENGIVPDSFQFQLSFNSSFSPMLLSGDVFTWSAVVDNMQYDQTYYWRVRNWEAGTPSVWSATNRFSTQHNTGIDTPGLPGDDVQVYPNPAHGSFTIQAPQNQNILQLTITDLQGRTLRTLAAPGTGSAMTISTDGLPAGIYTLHLQTATGMWTGKVAVQ